MVRLGLDETTLANISYIEFTEWLEELNGEQFESFIADVYEGLGYSVKVTQFSKDRGIDVRIQDEDELHLIQVKLKRDGKIGAGLIDQLVGAADRQYKEIGSVIFVTNSGFTDGAKRNRRDHFINGRFGVELIDGTKLYKKVSNDDLFHVMDDYFPYHGINKSRMLVGE
jgi:HJR/Mrr/RecB family endonuclease